MYYVKCTMGQIKTFLLLSQDFHYIIVHHYRCINGTYECQILCFRAVLAIGIATNSSVYHVFIRSQYGVFTE